MNDAVTGSTPARSGRGLATLALLLALVALGLAAYPYYQQRFGGAASVRARLDAEQTALEEMQQSLGDAKKGFDARLEQQRVALDKRFDEQNAHAAALLADITGSEATAAGAARMMRVLGLSEAEYLAQAAVRQLALSNDRRAIALLKAAQQALAGIDAPDDVEASLREALTALESQPAIDVDALYLKIQSVTEQLPEPLPVHGYAAQPVQAPAAESAAPRSVWQSAVAKFLSLFEFHRWDEGGEAPLDVANALELKLNVELLLRTAQVALLRRDEPVYRDSLAGARKLLERYRGAAAERATAAIAAIDQLSVLPLAQTPPDLGGLLEQLHAAVAGEAPQPTKSAPQAAKSTPPQPARKSAQAAPAPPGEGQPSAAATPAPVPSEAPDQPATEGEPQ
jgi:uroporphyrin-3 C-methyltransferase